MRAATETLSFAHLEVGTRGHENVCEWKTDKRIIVFHSRRAHSNLGEISVFNLASHRDMKDVLAGMQQDSAMECTLQYLFTEKDYI